jgi:tRNA modification GTPase
MKENNTEPTVCAISTPAGTGGIAVIRVSGEKAIEIVARLCPPAEGKKSLAELPANTVTFRQIVAPKSPPVGDLGGSNVIDEVLLTLFRAPHSFTGEDTVEISCHGSTYIQQEILRLLVENGCHLADAGEFTKRAFLNGKMDLSQAEAVADIIAASSSSSHRLALNQMRGGFSRELKELRSQLLNFVSLIELELDFSEENVEFANRSQLLILTEDIKNRLSRLVQSFSWGNAMKNGVPVVIVGETNAGKSTLLNLLLREDRAIVSDIHGTTRDTIEDVINVGGILFRFIDTAGIRYTEDEIELLGIERTFRKIEQASIIIWLIDTTHFSKEIEYIADRIVPLAKDKRLLIVFNKIDKISAEEQAILDEEFLPQVPAEKLYLSAKYRKNTEKLERALLSAANLPEIGAGDVAVTNVRHYEALTHALESVVRVENGLNTGLSADFIAQDIRETMHYLGEITGEITTDEVLGNIFAKFCIGK